MSAQASQKPLSKSQAEDELTTTPHQQNADTPTTDKSSQPYAELRQRHKTSDADAKLSEPKRKNSIALALKKKVDHVRASEFAQQHEKIKQVLQTCSVSVPIVPLEACEGDDYAIVFADIKCAEKHLVAVVEALQRRHRHNEGDHLFDLRLAPVRGGAVTLHVRLRQGEAQRTFFQHHVSRLNRLLVGGVNLPFPSQEAELTDAQRQRVLFLVLQDRIYTRAGLPVSAAVTFFPLHMRAAREARWAAVEVWNWRRLAADIDEDAVATYFGEETMFYFAWMNHYKRWLLGFGVLGLAVTISGYVLHLPLQDNPLVAVFVLSIVFGSVLCVKFWERRCQTLCMRYHLFHQREKDEPLREFSGTPGVDPVTGMQELQYPAWRRGLLLQPVSWAVITCFMMLTFAVVVLSLNLEGMTGEGAVGSIARVRQLSQPGGFFSAAEHPWRGRLPPLLYSIAIAVLSAGFTSLARALTAWENYRYRGDYIRALTQKRIVFEFVNSYAKLFYVAVVRRDLHELSSSLRDVFLFAAVSRLLVTTVIPFFVTHRDRVMQHLLRRSTASTGGAGDASALQDEADEQLDEYEVYDDFVEMAIQFGFITLFAVAFPLASFVALLSNFIEVRSDFYKMCFVARRSVPRVGLQECSTWSSVFRLISLVAVMTNIFLLTFTSNQVQTFLPSYFRTVPADPDTDTPEHLQLVEGRAVYVVAWSVVAEHVGMAIAVFLLSRISSQPEKVKVYIARKMYERARWLYADEERREALEKEGDGGEAPQDNINSAR